MEIIFLVLLVLGTTQAKPARHFPESNFGQTTMEFRTNRTMPLYAPVRPVLRHAQDSHLNFSMDFDCDHPILFKIGKCDEAFYRHAEPVSQFKMVFDGEGIAFLLAACETNCYGGMYGDGMVHLQAKATRMTQCKFTFKVCGLEVNFHEYDHVESPINSRMKFYKPTNVENSHVLSLNTNIISEAQHSKISSDEAALPGQQAKTPEETITSMETVIIPTIQKPEEKEDDSFFHLCAGAGTLMFIGLTILVAKCLNSDGLGDDEEQENVVQVVEKDVSESSSSIGGLEMRSFHNDEVSIEGLESQLEDHEAQANVDEEIEEQL